MNCVVIHMAFGDFVSSQVIVIGMQRTFFSVELGFCVVFNLNSDTLQHMRIIAHL